MRLFDPSVCASASRTSGVSEGLGEVVIKLSATAIAESIECAISVQRALGASILCIKGTGLSWVWRVSAVNKLKIKRFTKLARPLL